MTLFYTDVSNVNWSDDQNPQEVIDFLSQLRNQGIAGVGHKVTQGDDFVDWAWLTVIEWCVTNGFPVIGYHYVDTSDPKKQAKNWYNAHGTPNAMLDFENGSGTIDNFWDVVNAFNAVGTNVQLGYIPRWYDNSPAGGYGDLSALSKCGIYLVSSSYPNPGVVDTAPNLYSDAGGDSGGGWTSYNGATPVAWQFTDSARISGRNVDCNAYQGTNIRLLFGG